MSNIIQIRPIGNRNPLSDDDLYVRASSIFTQAPSSSVSDRYAFIPTTRVLEILKSEGWQPVVAAQSRTRSLDGKEFVQHMIRFQSSYFQSRNSDFNPELVLMNSHNGRSAFKLMLGVFRLVCSNGLVVCQTLCDSISIKHVGFKDQQVIDASYKVIETIPVLTNKVEEYRSIELTQRDQQSFAKQALELKYKDLEKAPIEPKQLLKLRRDEDNSSDLWSTFNVIQENLLRGGLSNISAAVNGNSRRTRTREVRSIYMDVRLNRELWDLTEKINLQKRK